MTLGWRASCILLWLVLLPVLGVLYLTVPVNPDQALFDYIGWSRVQGAVYYADVAEQNFPGEMLLHELGIRLFGVNFWTYRLLDYVVLQVATAAGTLILFHAGLRVAPWVFLVLYPALYVSSGYWMAGQRDVVAAGVLLIAAAATMSAWRMDPGLRAWRYLLAGALVAFAVLIRPTYLSYLVGIVGLEWLRFTDERGRSGPPLARSLLLLLGFAVPLGALAVLGAWTGSLDDFYEQAILFNLEAYPVEGSSLRLLEPLIGLLLNSWHWISGLAVGGLVAWIWTSGLVRAQALILGLMATVLVSYFAQNKGFGYHLAGLLPALCFFAAVLVDRLAAAWSAAPSGSARGIAAVALAAVVLLAGAGTAKKLASFAPQVQTLAEGRFEPHYPDTSGQNYTDVREMARLIREGTGPDDHVLQWGRMFEVGYLAERPHALRFVSTPALGILSDSFSASEAWLDEVRRDLEAKRPAFVLVDRSALTSESAPYVPRLDASKAERMVVESLSNYEPIYETPVAVLFRSK